MDKSKEIPSVRIIVGLESDDTTIDVRVAFQQSATIILHAVGLV
jgi:hypothetical protein